MGDKISEEKATLERENFCPKRSDLFSGDFNLQFHLRHRKKRSLVVDDWYAHSLSLSLSLSRSSFLSTFLPLQTGIVAFGGVFFLPQMMMVFASDATTDRIFY